MIKDIKKYDEEIKNPECSFCGKIKFGLSCMETLGGHTHIIYPCYCPGFQELCGYTKEAKKEE